MTTEDHYQQASYASGPAMAHPGPPGSPTLTNPDMILPDDEFALSRDRSPSPPRMWKGPVTINDIQYHMPLQNSFGASPTTPTTPIIYGNGTMLSDIGEVTEVESNVGGPAYRRSPAHFYHGASDITRGSSPTMGAHDGGSATTIRRTVIRKRSKTVARERSDSIDSTSTVTSRGRAAPFADFDDSVSVDDSVFQGDDEESVAESFADDVSVHSNRSHDRRNSGGLNDENRFSTSSIGRRAELILANAKKRLTTMEGNLSRARSSLYIHPALSSDGSTSAPSPTIPGADSAARDPNTTSKYGHSRMRSDNLIHPDTIPSPPGAPPQRSASALGAAGGYRQPLTSSKSVDTLKLKHAKKPQRASLPAPQKSLEPLSEDEMSHGPQTRDSAHLDNFLSPTFGPAPERPASRPGSVTQMRELKEQVSGLKGRISSLREQAKADSLKRRSLQSLRTASPFTNAEVDQWCPEPPTPEPQSAPEDLGAREEDVDHAPEGVNHPGPVAAPEEDESGLSEYEMASEGLRSQRNSAFVNGAEQHEYQVHGQMEQEGHVRTEDDTEDFDEFHDGRDDFDYASESGESLYHDAPQTALSHEDREDAFDYEHFFLHSAMGTLSQEHLGRRDSFSSEDSVETTKGPIATPEKREIRRHSRRGSGDSISTMDTFATADEEYAKRHSTTSSYYETSSGATDEPRPEAESGSGSDETSETNHSYPPTSFASPSYEEYMNGIHTRRRHNSVIHRPASTRASVLHRPSVSSFESTGTTRSFPLINGKAKLNGGVLTPRGSPDEELKSLSDALMGEAASVCEREGVEGKGAVMQALSRDDQILVQRLVAGLGRCVLGLSEGQASAEGRVFRRRLYEAKRILEGLEPTPE